LLDKQYSGIMAEGGITHPESLTVGKLLKKRCV